MKLKEKKTMTFECHASLVTQEPQSTVAQITASLSDLSLNFPEELNGNDFLWNLAGDLAVPGVANKNGHAILVEDAIRIKNQFVGQQVNKDHDRKQVVGFINKAIITDRETHLELTDEEAISCGKPVNLSIGFSVWPHVDENLARTLVAVTNPLVVENGYISLSWEMTFDEYYILVGSPSVFEGTIITDDAIIETYEPYLTWNGGKMKDAKGNKFYLVACGDDLSPLGAGLVVTPAAQVKGVIMLPTDKEQEDEIEEDDDEGEDETEVEDKLATANLEIARLNNLLVVATELNETLIKSSHPAQSSVTSLEHSIMKIKSITDITDENLGVEIKASAISDFLSDELAKESEKFAAEMKAKAEEAEVATAKLTELQTTLAELSAKNTEMDAKLQEIEAARVSDKLAADFNERMNVLDSTFELADADREIIAGQIRGLDDEAFTAWMTSFSVIASEKNKEIIASKAAIVIVASDETVVAPVAPVVVPEPVEKPLETLVAKETVLASTIAFSEDSIEKYKDAFSIGKGVTLSL